MPIVVAALQTFSLNINILTGSKYYFRLLADNPVKGRCNKDLVRRIRRGLALTKRSDDNLSISWTEARSTPTTPESRQMVPPTD